LAREEQVASAVGELLPNDFEGLCLTGFVLGRTMRSYEERKLEVVTYTIATSGAKYLVKDWNSSEYLDIGAKVSLPVKVKAYQSKTGTLLVDFTIARSSVSYGKKF
jgi:hypothetical protein